MAFERRTRNVDCEKKGVRNWFMKLCMWQRVLLCTVIVLICVAVGAVFYVKAKWDKIDSQKIKSEDLIINEEVRKKKEQEVDLGKGYTNIALFGVDSRDGNLEKGNRSDTIIVASLNNETKEIKMVSVYRDTVLNLSDDSYRKCNAAYSYGGPTMAVNMLNMNLDLDIEDYVSVDFAAITDVIDLVGGVEITVSEEEVAPLNKYVSETARSSGKKANKIEKAGTYLMDGAQATTYARIRSTAGGDFTRTERQRLVIQKVVEKIQKADLVTINKIIDQVFPKISTSFTLQELLQYAQAYSEYKLGDNSGFPFDKGTDTVSGLGSIVYAVDLSANVKQLHKFLFGEENYEPSSMVESIAVKLDSVVGHRTSGSAPSTEVTSETGGTGEVNSGSEYYEEPDYSWDDSYSGGYTPAYDSDYDDSYTPSGSDSSGSGTDGNSGNNGSSTPDQGPAEDTSTGGSTGGDTTGGGTVQEPDNGVVEPEPSVPDTGGDAGDSSADLVEE